MNIPRNSASTGSTLFVLLGALLALALPAGASAQAILGSDCNFGLQNVYMDNEPVCATGQTAGSVLGPPAFACIVPPGAAPNDGNDVTAGGCNAIPFGSFFDVFLWLPPLTPGTYDMVLVNNQGGFAFDSITVIDSGGAAPTVDVGAIKAAAFPNISSWEFAEDFGNYIDDAASAISLAYSLASGDLFGAAVAAGGLVTGFPTDYNGAVLSVGGQVIAALAGQQALYYSTLYNDPPDPNFTDIFPLDLGLINDGLAGQAALNPGIPLEYPFNNLSDDSLHLATIELANSLAEEAALVFTLTRTLEKFQGAEEADDDQFTLIQARALKMYADQLATQLSTSRQGLLDYQAELAADGVADVEYDGAEIAAIVDRLNTSGLTPEEEQSLRNVGFDDADIQRLFDRVATLPVPSGTFSRSASISEIIASNDIMSAGVQVLSGEAQEVIDHFEPMVTLQHPTADAGGPYAAVAGDTVNLDGSASTDPQAQALTYEWDFDLDGVFGDAIGVAATNSYNAPVVTQVGLKVTDTDGNEDVSYATVTISQANAAPQIIAFSPLDLAPTASNLNPLDFSANATDPDMDPLVYEWQVDGAVVSNNQNFTFTPGVGDTGTAAVRLTVSDLNPLSLDAVETRIVLLLDEVLTPDVVGLSEAQAQDDIVAAGLVVGTISTMSSATVPAGDIISQDPVGGTVVLAGSEVDLVVSSGPEDVSVPDVVGLAQAAAEADILSAGLAVGTVTSANSDTVPAGDVISQDPVGGTLVQPGTPVDLVVSVGPADVTVPDVVGLPQAAAEADILAANLAIGAVTTANSDTVPAGNVISQDPSGGSLVQPGTPVDLAISSGPADVAVPNVVGLPQAAAEADIVAAGLVVGTVTTANSDTVPAGNVISQQPVAGNLVQPGTPVDLVVSAGPGDVTVPDVVGLPQAAAEADIVAAGLVVGAVTTANSGTVPAGNVISQAPGGGSMVQPGTPVDLVVSAGPGDVTVPDVVGLPQAAAEADIVAAGLVVGAVTTANSGTVPAGNVISQAPGGGSMVQPGTPVNLVVSVGPADVTVPDVVGLPQAAAEADILAANLTVGTVSTANSGTVPAGNVISQEPGGGSMVQPGTPVNLVVSVGPADVTVPDVVGLPQAAAEADILAANLTVGTVSTANSGTVPAGNVISQEPGGGSMVQPGTPVNLVVSVGPAGSPPDAPTGLQSRVKALLVNLVWQPVDDATSYRVFRRLDTETEFVEAGTTPFPVFVNKLLDDTMFADYYVIATNEFGDSEASEILRLAPVFRDRPRRR